MAMTMTMRDDVCEDAELEAECNIFYLRFDQNAQYNLSGV